MLEVNGTEPALQLLLYVCGCICVWLCMHPGPRRPEADICVRPVTLLPAVSLISQLGFRVIFLWIFRLRLTFWGCFSTSTTKQLEELWWLQSLWSHHWGIFGSLHHAGLRLLIRNRGNELWQVLVINWKKTRKSDYVCNIWPVPACLCNINSDKQERGEGVLGCVWRGDGCSWESEKKTMLSKRVALFYFFLGGGFIRYMATCLVSFLSQDCLWTWHAGRIFHFLTINKYSHIQNTLIFMPL